MLPQPAQRRGPILTGGRTGSVPRVRPDFGRVMQERNSLVGTAQDIRKSRALVTGAAPSLVAEHPPAALGRLIVKTASWRLRSTKTQLIVQQRLELWGDQIGRLVDEQPDPRIIEFAFA